MIWGVRPERGRLAFTYNLGLTSIFGWPGSLVKLICDGEELGKGNWERSPTPVVIIYGAQKSQEAPENYRNSRPSKQARASSPISSRSPGSGRTECCKWCPRTITGTTTCIECPESTLFHQGVLRDLQPTNSVTLEVETHGSCMAQP